MPARKIGAWQYCRLNLLLEDLGATGVSQLQFELLPDSGKVMLCPCASSLRSLDAVQKMTSCNGTFRLTLEASTFANVPASGPLMWSWLARLLVAALCRTKQSAGYLPATSVAMSVCSSTAEERPGLYVLCASDE